MRSFGEIPGEGGNSNANSRTTPSAVLGVIAQVFGAIGNGEPRVIHGTENGRENPKGSCPLTTRAHQQRRRAKTPR